MNKIKKLLIVDDEEALTFSLCQIFIKSSMECEVITASSAEQAISRLEENTFDLVITDIAMPGMDGLELLSYIKKNDPGVKVIVITAYGSDERQDLAYQRGAEHYIEKPFDLRDIRDIVLKILS